VPIDFNDGGYYGEWGADIELRMFFITFFAYTLFLVLILTGVCDSRKPKNEGIEPDKEDREDVFVRRERDRVDRHMSQSSTTNGVDNEQNNMHDILKVLDLVKKYKKPDPTPQQD